MLIILQGVQILNKGSMLGMKAHDCDVFKECLLPIALRLDFVWSALAESSQFFKDLCSNTLRTKDVIIMQENIPIIIYKLERIFFPTFFYSMEHLVIHLSMDVLVGGLVHYHWMYNFER